jgi:uncharacterized protein YwqG
MNRADVAKLLAGAGLERVAADIQQIMQGSLRLSIAAIGDDRLPVGASKLGGQPDLPTGSVWPGWKGLPMSFIAQIRLADTGAYPWASALPRSGLLSFFYDARQETYGADVGDRGGWQVRYTDGDPAHLRRLPVPNDLPAAAQFSAGNIAFSVEPTLPALPANFLPSIKWTPDEVKRYEDLLANFPSPAAHTLAQHRLLGHPNQLQDDMQLQCALLANGVATRDDPRAAALAKTTAQWRLLLQVDSDERLGMKWATAGMLYYWIEQRALESRRFDRTWLVLQAD